MNKSEKAMIDLITQIEILVSYNNQLTLLDEIEKILNKEQRQLFQSLRKDTIESDEPSEEELSKKCKRSTEQGQQE